VLHVERNFKSGSSYSEVIVSSLRLTSHPLIQSS